MGEEQLNSQASEAQAADERIIANEQEHRAWVAVGNLDTESEAELKTIFLLGQTYPEAASQLDLPLATLKSRVRRTVLKIRGKLADD